MEPMCCTARVEGDRAEVWAGVQDPLNGRVTASKALGIPQANVQYHNLLLGGGFGRKLPGLQDFIDMGARIAKAMSPAPVKMIWSRENDIQLADAPEIRVEFIRSDARLGGMGEPCVPPVAAAVANAIFAATGIRVRDLPVKNHDLSRAQCPLLGRTRPSLSARTSRGPFIVIEQAAESRTLTNGSLEFDTP
jgi:CO/xanthine dehydrogenase Mo-binding subunit